MRLKKKKYLAYQKGLVLLSEETTVELCLRTKDPKAIWLNLKRIDLCIKKSHSDVNQ